MTPCWIKYYGPPSAVAALVGGLRGEGVKVVYQPPLSLVGSNVLAEGIIARDILCIGHPLAIEAGVWRFEQSDEGMRTMVHVPGQQSV